MACACNKNRTTGIEAKRASSQPVMPAAAPKAPAPVQTTGRTRTTPVMHGQTQSFALQVGGKTAKFGSALERDAAAARTGGKVVQ